MHISENNKLHVRRHLFQEFLFVYLFFLPDIDVMITLVQYFVCRITHFFQLLRTRSSADADNRLDAFSGQSSSTNMVPFHMLHIVSYCAIVTLSVMTFYSFYDIRLQKIP